MSCNYENYVDGIVPVNSKPLKIMSWNINGDLKAKMLCPEFVSIIMQYDICFLQETHLYPLEHESLNLPEIFNVISLPRNYKKAFMKQFGGVIALFNRQLNVSYNKELSSSHIMVLVVNKLILVNAYILPKYQTWDAFTDVDPFQRLQETLTALQELSLPILLMGDFNARTGCRGTHEHTRKSKDEFLSTRGRALIDSCTLLELILLNGIQQFETKSQMFTSFQPHGQAVVDYVIANKTGLELTLDFEVLHHSLGWSDHAALSLDLMLPGEGPSLTLPTRRASHKILSRQPVMFQDSNNPLDALQKNIMNEISTPKAKLICLYGLPTPLLKVIEVYTDGSCHGNGTKDARAGAGVFWGMNAPNNLAARVPGKQTNKQSW
jgi:exonuclease III